MADNGDDSSNTQSNSQWKKSRLAGGLRAAGSSLSDSGRDMMDSAGRGITPVAYKRGGKVRKTGMAKVHKGERVISKDKAKRVTKMMRKAGMRLKARQ